MLDSQPIWTANGIVALVSALIVLGVALGLPISTELKAAILGVVVIVAPAIAAWWASKRTTPLVAPKDEDGRRLVREGTQDPSLPQARAEAKKRQRVGWSS